MSENRRLLFYNDSRHFYMYCYDPPIRLEDAWAPVDELLGTAVNTLVHGSGPGGTVFHDTQVGEIWGSRFKEFDTLYGYQATENIESLIARGLDPLNVLIERAHEKGMEFFASVRQSHGGSPDDDGLFNYQFKVDHPEWCMKSRDGNFNFDFSVPEVRAERFALIEEYANRYDVDGIEIDWVFEPYYFEVDEVADKRSILTEYTRQIRESVDEAARVKGKTIALGARVLPTQKGNMDAGMDVAAWMRDGLLDFVVPNVYGYHHIDADLPIEWLVEMARTSECKIYPALQQSVYGVDPLQECRLGNVGYYPADLHHYYAAAAACWAKGGDGIYLPWFPYPHGSHHRLLSEIHDSDILREKPKHYVVRNGADDAAGLDYTAPLPMPLKTGATTPQTVPLFAADDGDRGDVVLRLRLDNVSPKDAMTVTLNGQSLEESFRQQFRYSFSMVDYRVPIGVLRRGENEVGVALESRPARLTGGVVLTGVELQVTYRHVMPEAS